MDNLGAALRMGAAIVKEKASAEEALKQRKEDAIRKAKAKATEGEGEGKQEKDEETSKEQDGSRRGEEKELKEEKKNKKLSRRERKKLEKKAEDSKRHAIEEINAARASAEGAQFACSQTALDENDRQWKNSLDINVPSFSVSAAGNVLFDDATLHISQGRRYGLVAPNGKGKSTLLKMIATQKLMLPPRIDHLYVEQEVMADDTPAIDAVLRANARQWALLEEEKALSKELESSDDYDSNKVERLQEIHEQLRSMGADASEAKARRVLHGLGFDATMQNKPTKMFSGGWTMRISLARALFIEPTLLMLDEPTNHLDLNAVIWLDDYLQNWNKMLLVVSHDQAFLNSVCEEILHIEDTKLISYKGNYDSFKAIERMNVDKQTKEWKAQQKRIRAAQKNGKGAKETKLIKRPKEYRMYLEFAEVPRLSGSVLEVKESTFRYSPKDPVLFNKIDFGIDMNSRICIAGPNGSGKSTLLKLLTGQVEATKGEVKRNPRLRMGVYNQHFVDVLPLNQTPVEFLRQQHRDENYQSVCKILGTYGLERHAHELAIRDLSGGQKARVVFANLTLMAPHLLLLDEPTNNLDVETIDALVEAIKEFNGGIVVVTHDQRLIDECDCDLWVVENQGVARWEGTFEAYKDMLLVRMKEQAKMEEERHRKLREAKAAARGKKLAALGVEKKSG